MSEVMIVSTKQELFSNGYVYENVGKEFIYEGSSFLLKQQGLLNIPITPFMGYPNPNHIIQPRAPVWIMKVKDLEMDNESFKPIESIIYSMTPKERSNPDILDGKRKKRIALGSGNSIQEVNQLLKQFNQMKKMMKIMKKSGPSGMMSALGINE